MPQESAVEPAPAPEPEPEPEPEPSAAWSPVAGACTQQHEKQLAKAQGLPVAFGSTSRSSKARLAKPHAAAAARRLVP